MPSRRVCLIFLGVQMLRTEAFAPSPGSCRVIVRRHPVGGSQPQPDLIQEQEKGKYLKRGRCLTIASMTTRIKPSGSPKNSKNDKSDKESVEDGYTDLSVSKSLLLLFVSQFMLFVGVGAVIPSIPLYGKEIGLSSAANGIVISAPSVVLFLASRLSGAYADNARKPAMLWGMGVIAISDFATAMATSVPGLVLARFGLGLGRCLSEAGERGMLADLANQIPEFRGRALAVQQAVAALGIAIGAPIGGIVVEHAGPRAAFLCVSVAAIGSLLLYALLPETVLQDTSTEVLENKGKQEATADEDGEIWRTLLAEAKWRSLALCQSGITFGFAAKIACIPIIAAEVLPGGAAGAGALVSAVGLSGLLGAPLGGWVTDRAGAKATALVSGLVSATSLILIPIALSSFVDGEKALFGLSPGGLGFVGLVIIWGVGVASQGPALVALGQKMAPKGAEATAMALPRAAGDGTYIIAPFLLGVGADLVPSIEGFDCFLAGLASLFGVVALLGIREEKGVCDR